MLLLEQLRERHLQWESTLQGWTSLVDHSSPGRRLVDLHNSAVVEKHSSWHACEGKLSDLTQFARISMRSLLHTQQRRHPREGARPDKAIALHGHEVMQGREITMTGNTGLVHNLAHHRDVQN